MQSTFDVQEYIRLLGQELVDDFTRAGLTTHPQAVGSGREISAREKLNNILPAGVGIGSGFVIDSFGNTSQQADIILYEKDYAMKFLVNGDESNTYYNVESVIAVGEVKSEVGVKELQDTIVKLKKINNLHRYNDDGYNYRKYLSATSVRNSLSDEKGIYNADRNTFEQVYTFLLCQKLNVSIKTVLQYMRTICEKDCEYVNKLYSVDGAYISFLKKEPHQWKVLTGKNEADALFNLKDNRYAFNYFINDLLGFINAGCTVPLNYQRYLQCGMTASDIKEVIDL